MPRMIALLSLLLLFPASVFAQLRPQLGGPGARAVHEPFAGPITAAKIRTAIDDAVMFLRNQQRTDGSITLGSHPEGGTALAALTMLASGAHPATDDQLKRALDWLGKTEPDNVYVRGIRANVWEYALRKVPYDKRIRELLKVDYDWLLQALGDKEAWRYNMASRNNKSDWDNSCTQYGVLGLWAAARAGFDPGEKFWITMSKHFRSCQNEDGGWGYTRSGSSPNMATAGLASMFLVFDMYHGRNAYTRENPRTFTEGDAAEVLVSIGRGMTWLGKSSGNKNSAYYLYGIERTGVASGRKYIGGEDWFANGAQTVLSTQQSNGFIPLGQWGDQVVGTSFCTLFLVYGGAPVALEKLEYGEGQDWNLNPRDLANLSKHLWAAYERPVNWQTVSLETEASEFEAPILFISGSKAVNFTEEEMLKLREYVLRGGTILAEPSDHSEEFTQSMEQLVRLMFSKKDYPNYELKPLPADHGIYAVIKQSWNRRPRLRGVSDGSRTFFLVSDEYLSRDWQMNKVDSDAFRLAMNLLFYATDLGALEGKFAAMLPDTAPAKEREAVLRVARVKHAGIKRSPSNWNAAAMCWRKFAPYVKHITGCELSESSPVTLAKDSLEGIRMLHLTGREKLTLSEEERAELKQFVVSGGTVLVDAYAGSPAFATSAKAIVTETFGPLQTLPTDHVLAEGRFEGGEDLSDGVQFKLPARRLLRSRDESTRGQKLLVAWDNKRPAVFFSEFDLASAMADIENYRSLGYKPRSARKIVGNIAAYVMVD